MGRLDNQSLQEHQDFSQESAAISITLGTWLQKDDFAFSKELLQWWWVELPSWIHEALKKRLATVKDSNNKSELTPEVLINTINDLLTQRTVLRWSNDADTIDAFYLKNVKRKYVTGELRLLWDVHQNTRWRAFAIIPTKRIKSTMLNIQVRDLDYIQDSPNDITLHLKRIMKTQDWKEYQEFSQFLISIKQDWTYDICIVNITESFYVKDAAKDQAKTEKKALECIKQIENRNIYADDKTKRKLIDDFFAILAKEQDEKGLARHVSKRTLMLLKNDSTVTSYIPIAIQKNCPWAFMTNGDVNKDHWIYKLWNK